MPLTDLRTLGRSGLPVSPLSLGTMTFGAARWGSADDVSEAVFDAYVGAGGNFVDTADVYSGGHSEELVGRYVAARGLRDRLVIATKCGFNGSPPAASGAPRNPLAGGNGRKNVRRALEGSLRRLGTDYVDLYWLHTWDGLTPAEEVLQTMGALVAAGHVRYYGLSNVPAWWATKLATLAAAHGAPGPVALQLEYSLVSRVIEREHVPAALDLGIAVVPWSPLAGGFLAGKYERPAAETGAKAEGEGRLAGTNPFGDTKFTDANWRVLDALRGVAADVGRTPAETALAWALGRTAVVAPIVGARTPEQLAANLAALDVTLTAEQRATLDQASAPEPVYPYPIFEGAVRRGMFGGAEVRGWP